MAPPKKLIMLLFAATGGPVLLAGPFFFAAPEDEKEEDDEEEDEEEEEEEEAATAANAAGFIEYDSVSFSSSNSASQSAFLFNCASCDLLGAKSAKVMPNDSTTLAAVASLT